MPDLSETKTQRLDKWLWCARFFKTRSLAAKAASDGNIRLTRNDQTIRISKAAYNIQAEDTLAFTRGERLLIVKILCCATRRGPAIEAQTLYEDLSPPPPPKPEKTIKPFERESGAGRPTKKDRRALDDLREED